MILVGLKIGNSGYIPNFAKTKIQVFRVPLDFQIRFEGS